MVVPEAARSSRPRPHLRYPSTWTSPTPVLMADTGRPGRPRPGPRLTSLPRGRRDGRIQRLVSEAAARGPRGTLAWMTGLVGRQWSSSSRVGPGRKSAARSRSASYCPHRRRQEAARTAGLPVSPPGAGERWSSCSATRSSPRSELISPQGHAGDGAETPPVMSRKKILSLRRICK
jgi:hypothetical protein